jgi:hypothetical protein
MSKITLTSDLAESNGKTIRENNLSTEHTIPIHTPVIIQLENEKAPYWTNNGNVSDHIIYLIEQQQPFFVAEHTRDCDGTCLYTLSTTMVDLNGQDPHTYMAKEINIGDYNISDIDKMLIISDMVRHSFITSLSTDSMELF